MSRSVPGTIAVVVSYFQLTRELVENYMGLSLHNSRCSVGIVAGHYLRQRSVDVFRRYRAFIAAR